MSDYSSSWQNVSSATAAATRVDPTVLLLSQIFSYASFFYEVPFWSTGLLFNLNTLIIFSFSSQGTTETTRVYYLTIAACDLLTLVFKHGFWYLFSYGIFVVGSSAVWRAVDNQVMCNMCRLVWASAETVANGTLVALGLERTVVLYWPFKAGSFKRSKSLIGLCGLSVFAVALNSTSVDIGAQNQSSATVFSVVFCSSSGLTSTAISAMRAVSLLCIYFVPSICSIVLAVFINVKVKEIVKARAGLTGGLVSRGEIESCVTILVMSVVHVTLFIPLTVFRTFTILLPFSPLNNALSSTLKQSFQVIGFLLFVFAVPVHSTDFLIYCKRVPGFWTNVKRILTLRLPHTHTHTKS